MTEYELIAMGGIALIGISALTYLDLKKKERIKEFSNWVDNYVIPKAEEIRKSNRKLKNLIDKLKEKDK